MSFLRMVSILLILRKVNFTKFSRGVPKGCLTRHQRLVFTHLDAEFRIQHILLGKLWNAMSTANYNAPLANGFNGSDFLLDPYTYIYFNASMTRNGGAPVNYEN